MSLLHLRISRQALNALIVHATKGFETHYKREVGGHLFGYLSKDGFYVSRAIPYKTPYSSRTGWGIKPYNFRRKGRSLETRRTKWIGTYHSHVEINRSASTGQSREDKEAHLFFEAPVDIVLRITTYKMRAPKVCLSYKDNRAYYYDICGYVKDPQRRIRPMKVECSALK